LRTLTQCGGGLQSLNGHVYVTGKRVKLGFMKSLTALFLVFVCTFAISQESKWTTLFDGKMLTGWESTSDANWGVEDGTIVVDEGEGGFLLHKDTYKNFELSVEFKAAKGTNSGVFLNTMPKPKNLTEDCYELNIAPPDNPFPTGSLVARAKVEGAGESDEWRKFEVRVENGRVIVKLDGKQVVDYQAETPSRGNRIGLQKNSGWVAFRNINVRKLP